MFQEENTLNQISARVKLTTLCTQNLGALYLPHGIIESADTNGINAHSSGSLLQRAHLRLRHCELQRQLNLEEILGQVAKKCAGDITAQIVDRDWASLFFSFVLDVSDAQMQILWANAMLQELQKPGSISKCSLKFLHSLDSWEVKAFKKVAVSAFVNKSGHPFLFRSAASHHHKDQLFFEGRLLSHCMSAGLIREELVPLKNGFEFYYDEQLQHVNNESGYNSSHTGFYTQRFTKIGSDLFRLVQDSTKSFRLQAQQEVWSTLSDFIHLKALS